MKTNYIFKIVLICILIKTSSTYSQTTYIHYTNDDAGNRIKRELKVIELKSTNITNDTTQTDSLSREEFNKSSESFGKTTVNVFPNPTPGIAQIEVGGELPESVSTFQVFDLTGKSILSATFNESTTNIDLSAYPNGKYILKIICNNKSKEWILIKQ